MGCVPAGIVVEDDLLELLAACAALCGDGGVGTGEDCKIVVVHDEELNISQPKKDLVGQLGMTESGGGIWVY